MNQYNQVPHLTRDTIWKSEKNTLENITHKRVKRSALFKQIVTSLQGTDKPAQHNKDIHETQITKTTKEARTPLERSVKRYWRDWTCFTVPTFKLKTHKT